MNKMTKFFWVLLGILFLQNYCYIVSAWSEEYDQIASIYSLNTSFSFKEDLSPPKPNSETGLIANYVLSDSLFILPQNPDVFRVFKFLIPPGVDRIVLGINNNTYNSPDTESGQCNMLSFEINKTNIDDPSFDVTTNAIGILMQDDKSDFWAGNKSLRFGWNNDKATFGLDCPDKESDNYKLIKTSGVWCYMKTTSCVQQFFNMNIQMTLRDVEEYTAWYELMNEKGGWDDSGNPVSDLSSLDGGDTSSNLEIINDDIPTTAVVNETVNCGIQISGGVVPYTYHVDFGDNVDDSKNSDDLSASFDHVYTTAGSYTIEVKVTDGDGNEESNSYQITVQDEDNSNVYSIDFNYESASDPYVYKFTPLVSNNLPETCTYQWDFGVEGAESVSPDNPDTGEISYSFSSEGEGFYTITLKAISSDGMTSLAEKIRTIYIDGPELEITIVDDSDEDPSGKIYSLNNELALKVSIENPALYTYSWSEYPNGTELGAAQSYTYKCATQGRNIIRVIVTEIETQRQGTDYAVIYVGESDNTFSKGFESGIEYCKEYPFACGIAQIQSNEGYNSGYNDGYQEALVYKGAQVSFADDILNSLDLSINNMRFPLNGVEYELSCILEYMPYDGDEILWRLLIDDSFNLDLVK